MADHCEVPPAGWSCSRAPGHDGPCAATPDTRPAPAPGKGVREAVQPWADYHGDLPDYDHPLRCVYESGIQYAVELLAKELGVDEWTLCDGTEEFDGDLGGTLMNIVLAAMPKDEHGDAIYPRDLLAALATQPAASVGDQAIAKIIHDECENDDDSDGGAYLRAARKVRSLFATQPAAGSEG